MSNIRKDLEQKTIQFSKSILKYCSALRPTLVTKPLIDHLVRSATSIGANFAEATSAASRSDFRNKISSAKKETAETKYWLTLLEDYSDDKQNNVDLKETCQQLLISFQKISNRLSEQHNSPKKLKIN